MIARVLEGFLGTTDRRRHPSEDELRAAHDTLSRALGLLAEFEAPLLGETGTKWAPWVGLLCVPAAAAAGMLVDLPGFVFVAAMLGCVVFCGAMGLTTSEVLCDERRQVGDAIVRSLTLGETLVASEMIWSSHDIDAPTRSRHHGVMRLRRWELLVTAIARLHRERGHDVADELRELVASVGKDADRVVEHIIEVVAAGQAR